MATANNTIKTRIQLKSDTEVNWNKAGPKDGNPGFIPLRGELIIYSADETHAFSRLKVGDGVTNVVSLPFIDAGTLNGEQPELVKKSNFEAFPSPGSSDKLYIDLSTDKIYHYENASGYTQLANFSVSTTAIKSVSEWLPGASTKASIENNTFKIINGVTPRLDYKNLQVVTDVN